MRRAITYPAKDYPATESLHRAIPDLAPILEAGAVRLIQDRNSTDDRSVLHALGRGGKIHGFRSETHI